MSISTHARTATRPLGPSRTATSFPGIPLGYDRLECGAPLGFSVTSDLGHVRASPVSELVCDRSDGGLVTVAGTGSGKGVSQVIPTALTYPGSMVILDIKGEIAAVTANARRKMGQDVIILDPFGSSEDAFNPMEAINPASPDAPDQCRRFAKMICGQQSLQDPFWDDAAEMIIAGSLLFLTMYIPRRDRNLGLLYRMWGVADHLREMLAIMSTSEVHGGFMMSAARLYIDAPDRTAGSIMTTLRQHIAFLGSSQVKKSLSGTWGLLKKIKDGTDPFTIYLRVPPHLLHSHGQLLRVWLGTLITTVAERMHRPAVADLFLVDEAATLGRLDELLTAASLLRGYGLRTWTFWQSLSQMRGIYGERAGDFLDNASTLTAFGASNAASARALADLTGYPSPLLGMPRDAQVLCMQGEEPRLITRIDYLRDPVYRGLFDPNPFYGRRAVANNLEAAA